jgi:hypothetical protein
MEKGAEFIPTRTNVNAEQSKELSPLRNEMKAAGIDKLSDVGAGGTIDKSSSVSPASSWRRPFDEICGVDSDFFHTYRVNMVKTRDDICNFKLHSRSS